MNIVRRNFYHRATVAKIMSISFILKLFVILASCIALFYETSELVRLYYKYPTVVNVKLEKEMMIELPSITICVPIILTKSRLLTLYRKEIENELNVDWDNDNISLEMSQIFNKYNNIAFKDYKTSQLFEMSLRPSKFIDCTLSLPSFKNPKTGFGCENISEIIESFNTNGKCFTYFSQLNKADVDVNDYRVSLYQNLKSSMGGIASLDMNFPLEEYTNYWDITMATISIHPPNMIPWYEKTHKLYPGVSYDIYFSKTLSKLLKAPYETGCTTYQNADPNLPQSRADCVDKCIINIWESLCNCTPPHLSIRKEVDQRDKYLCRSDQKVNHSVAGEMKNGCYDQCLPDCIEEEYDFEVEENSSPSERDIAKSIGFKEKQQLMEKKKRHANINLIRRFSGDVTYTHTPQMPFIEFVCYVGSLASLWLGVSVLTIYDCFEKIFWYLVEHFSRFYYQKKYLKKVNPQPDLTRDGRELFVV